jgi:transcriptional regulator with XRE-family HTH domain
VNDEARRRALAAFLRKKRERLQPPSGSQIRRLTPGLRREEVAEQAGVGTTWYTWLEQARDIRPSERTLRRIARALRLDKTETKYLLDLAVEQPPVPPEEKQVPRPVLSIVHAVATPAFVLGRVGDFAAYNTQANALLDLDFAPDPNFFRVLFSEPARRMLVNWDEFASHMLAVFRRRTARVAGDPSLQTIVAELSERSGEFRRWWAEQALPEIHSFELVFDHPFVGHLAFDIVCFGIEEHQDFSLVGAVYEHDRTREKLDELIRQKGTHDAGHNLWTALTPTDHHSQYQ